MTSLAELVSEQSFHHAVTEMAERLGWLTFHDNDSRRNDPGFPDLLCIHPDHGLIWLELKTVRGRLRPIQRQWIDLLQMAGQRAFVVRPTDMDFLEALFRGEMSLDDALDELTGGMTT